MPEQKYKERRASVCACPCNSTVCPETLTFLTTIALQRHVLLPGTGLCRPEEQEHYTKNSRGGAARSAQRFRNSGIVEDTVQNSLLKRFVTMMRNGDRFADRIVNPDMMTAADAIELVAISPQVLLDLLGGQRFHA